MGHASRTWRFLFSTVVLVTRVHVFLHPLSDFFFHPFCCECKTHFQQSGLDVLVQRMDLGSIQLFVSGACSKNYHGQLPIVWFCRASLSGPEVLVPSLYLGNTHVMVCFPTKCCAANFWSWRVLGELWMPLGTNEGVMRNFTVTLDGGVHAWRRRSGLFVVTCKVVQFPAARWLREPLATARRENTHIGQRRTRKNAHGHHNTASVDIFRRVGDH